MALPAVAGNTIYASDLYPLYQPAGGTDADKFKLSGWAGASGDVIACYMPSRSRGATPVSITLGTVYDAATGVGTPINTANLDQYGCLFWQTATGASSNCHYGQYFTWQY